MTLRLIVEPVVRAALIEDLGRAGDITTDAIVPAEATVEAVIAARQPGVVAGLQAALLAFELVDPALRIEQLCDDGARIARGETVARISGRARGVLGAERTALNFLCRMSGIATATRGLADAIAGYDAKIVCTRKTTPGLRALEKHAVRLGGGANHRFGLDDAMLIKDNHIALAGGVRAALGGELPEAAALRETYRRRALLLSHILADAPHCRALPPEGGMFVLLDIRGTGLGAEDFARALLEREDVALLPCEGFGPSAVGHLRIALTAPEPRLEDAGRRIVRFARTLAG